MLRAINRTAYNVRLTPVQLAFRNTNWQRFYTKDSKNDHIFIHPHANSKFKISLSPNENAMPIGYSTDAKVNTSNFEDNEDFIAALQSKVALDVHDDFSFIVEAGTFANSFMPIYDFREIPSFGRIPEVENIFGYVHVNEGGKIIPGSYEPNSMYRLCNRYGLPRLSDFLYDCLRQKCESTD